VGEVAVVLHIYQGDTETATLETTTNAEGRFQFDGLDANPNLEYWPEAIYLDVPYSVPEPLQFQDGQSSLSTTLTVYETTSDDAAVSLSSVHSIVESFGEVLRITEIHLLSNSADRTYVGGSDEERGMTVFIPLPDTAVGLSFEDEMVEGRFVEVDGGFRDSAPVPPGSETSLIFFSYHLMVLDDTIPLERYFAYPVADLNMLVAQPGLTVRSEQLQSRGSQLFQDRQYEFFVAENLEAGIPLTVEFIQTPAASAGVPTTGMPPSGAQDPSGGSVRGNQGLLLWIGFGLAGLAVIGAVVYSATIARPTSAQRSRRSLTADPRAQRLLAELADLEGALEAEQIDQETYESQRAELYRKLKSL
jgi:hypothetical protein